MMWAGHPLLQYFFSLHADAYGREFDGGVGKGDIG
jgi:hypothetical protein